MSSYPSIEVRRPNVFKLEHCHMVEHHLSDTICCWPAISFRNSTLLNYAMSSDIGRFIFSYRTIYTRSRIEILKILSNLKVEFEYQRIMPKTVHNVKQKFIYCRITRPSRINIFGIYSNEYWIEIHFYLFLVLFFWLLSEEEAAVFLQSSLLSKMLI